MPCEDLLERADWFETADRHLARDEFQSGAGEGMEVSTVFLGLDMNFGLIGEAILFETMVFGGVLNDYQWRWCTWEEAEEGHAQAVALSRMHERLDEAGEEGGQAARLAARVMARQMAKVKRG